MADSNPSRGKPRFAPHAPAGDSAIAAVDASRIPAEFAALADFIPQLVWICTPDGLNIYFNRRWVDYTGLTPEESYGRGWNTPFHPDDKQPAWNAWNRAVQEGEQYNIQARLRAADGSYRRFLVRGEPMRNPSGGVLRWLGTCTDIEDLRQESEGKFRSVLEASRDVIYRVNLQTGQYEYISPSAEAVTGFSSNELMAQSMEAALAMVHPDDLSGMRAGLATLEECGEVEMEYRQHTKDGDYRWLSNRASLVKDGSGRPLYRDGNIRDITERKQTEEALQQFNRTLKARGDSSQALLHAVDEDTYLKEVCRIVTEDCGHVMMWIGFTQDDENKSVRLAASSGFEDGYLDSMKFSWDDNPWGRGPTGVAIRTGKPAMCRNMLTDPAFLPWREGAIKRGYASSLVVPLMEDDRAFGAFCIYARQPNAFSDAEVSLLTELAADLSFGIRTLRLRGAHAHAEQALRESEQRLRLLGDNLPDSAVYQYVHDTDGRPRFLYLSAGTERLNGVSVSDVLRDAGELHRQIPPAYFSQLVEAEARSARELIDFDMEVPMRRPDGEVRWMRLHSRPRRLPDGRVVWDGVQIDVTHRKQAEEALREGEERLKLLIEHAPVALAMFDREMRYLHASRRWQTSYNLGDRPLRGLSHYEVFPEIGEDWKQLHRRGLAGEVLLSEGDRFERADGSTQWVRWAIHPWRDSAGAVGGIVIFSEDITERKRVEEALLRSEKLASVGRMAATIAHEINNPLAAVTNVLYLVKQLKDLPEAARPYLDTAEEELQRVAHITRQSLGFYRESNAPAPTSVNALLQSTMSLLRNKIKAKQAIINTQFDEDVEITAVAGELRQVFSNLLSNSLDAIEERGTIRFRVSACTAPRNGHRYLRITIADNGKGIPATSRPHIFEPFFTTKGEFGTGLGLWVSKQIIDNHKGTIRLRSRTGTGTVFSIALPMQAGAAASSHSSR